MLSNGHVSSEVPHTPPPGLTEWFSESYPCDVSSRAFKTAMTLPRWAPEFFSRPITMISPPCLRKQSQEGAECVQEAVRAGGDRTRV